MLNTPVLISSTRVLLNSKLNFLLLFISLAPFGLRSSYSIQILHSFLSSFWGAVQVGVRVENGNLLLIPPSLLGGDSFKKPLALSGSYLISMIATSISLL